jgi:hypothetical protein
LRLSEAKTEDVTSYVARVQKVRLELVAAGELVSDERLVTCILRGLQEEFANVNVLLLYQQGLNGDKRVSHLRVAE